MSLERYRDIVPDWNEFEHVVATPEPVTFRVRAALAAPDAVLQRLARLGFEARSVAGIDGFFEVLRGPHSVAQTLDYWLGLLHVQQAVMGLPALALAPRSGERVLDLCAAPGGKTAHLSELMQERGALVAVDPKEKRLRGLLANVYRMGYTNVVVVAADGRTLPGGALFDRVLVDAPCSGEGNCRRGGRRSPSRSARFQAYVTTLQEALLRRAIELTRPGGVIVYSTCTFAPEENEGVLDRVLRDAPASLEPITLDVPHAPGLLEWEGRRFSNEMPHAWRVYPHHLDSGGLFMARLRRLDDGHGAEAGSGWSPIARAFPGEDEEAASRRIADAKEKLEYWFASSRDLDRLEWMARGDHLWAHTATVWPVPQWRDGSDAGWRVVSVGLRALRLSRGGLETPSSVFLRRLGSTIAAERTVSLDEDELRALLQGHVVPVTGRPRGPVAVTWNGLVLGRGMVRQDGLSHEFGKPHAKSLARLLSILTGGP